MGTFKENYIFEAAGLCLYNSRLYDFVEFNGIPKWLDYRIKEADRLKFQLVIAALKAQTTKYQDVDDIIKLAKKAHKKSFAFRFFDPCKNFTLGEYVYPLWWRMDSYSIAVINQIKAARENKYALIKERGYY